MAPPACSSNVQVAKPAAWVRQLFTRRSAGATACVCVLFLLFGERPGSRMVDTNGSVQVPSNVVYTTQRMKGPGGRDTTESGGREMESLIAEEEGPVECPADNSLEQLRRFWHLWRTNQTEYSAVCTEHLDPRHAQPTSRGFAYRVDRVSTGRQRRYTITESLEDRVNVGGGSNFRAEVRGPAGITKCSAVDHFDGTYSVCCPPVPEPCGTNFTITLSFTKFFAYQAEGPTVPLLEPIYTETGAACASLPHTRSAVAVPVRRCERPVRMEDSHTGVWRAVQGQRRLRWVVQDGDSDSCVHDMLSNDTIHQCLHDHLHTLRLFGDSHMRVLARYMARIYNSSFDGQWGHVHTKVSDEFYYYWTGLGWEVWPCMNDATLVLAQNGLIKPPLSRKDVVVVGNGAWDLWRTSVSDFLNTSAPGIINIVSRVREDPVFRDARVMYVTNYGYPVSERHPGFRSEFAARAADQYIAPRMRERGVEVFDVLPLTDSRSGEPADDHHWLSDEGEGEVGLELAHLLIRAICGL